MSAGVYLYLLNESLIETGDEGCQLVPFLAYLVDRARRVDRIHSTRFDLITEHYFALSRVRIRSMSQY